MLTGTKSTSSRQPFMKRVAPEKQAKAINFTSECTCAHFAPVSSCCVHMIHPSETSSIHHEHSGRQDIPGDRHPWRAETSPERGDFFFPETSAPSGGRLAIAQFADYVACHLPLCGGRLSLPSAPSRQQARDCTVC